MKKTFLTYLGFWIVIAVLVTAVAGVVYATVHQSLRQSANDPQIQMAEDTAYDLDHGRKPQDFDSNYKIDIARSLAPYVIIYDKTGQVIVSTALLNNQAPQVPVGVLQASDLRGQNKVTWQPEDGIRSAIVAKPFQDGYVLAGRSLREVEKREDLLGMTVGLFWVFTLIVSFILTFLLYLFSGLINR